MPELPDVEIYVERLEAMLTGQVLIQTRIRSPFVLRSTAPPIEAVWRKRVQGFRRIGKRIVFVFDDDLFFVIHLMIAGRLKWRKRDAAVPKRAGLMAFDFASGSLLFTEASKKHRASLHVVCGETQLAQFDRGGLEVFEADLEQFATALCRENHTLKRALTDPRILSGIGNAYSDEILHRARMSPFRQTKTLDPQQMAVLYHAIRDTLGWWIKRHRNLVGDGFPEKVTAFHPEMAVHGKYGEACPVCAKPIQRIVYAQNESNYCAKCQTGGRVFADRALSRLLKDNWPRNLEELEGQTH